MSVLSGIRLINLRRLAKEVGGTAELSRLIGYKQPSYLYQILNQTAIQNGKPKNIGSKMARKIEVATGKPEYWLDTSHPPEGLKITDSQEYITFDRLEITAKLGNGAYNSNHPKVVEQIKVTPEWAHKHIGNNLSAINLINASGDSMQGTIEDGDVLFVDTTVRECLSEGIYAFVTSDGTLRVKRLKKTVKGELLIISDNPVYPIETLKPDEANYITICGRVVAHSAVTKL